MKINLSLFILTLFVFTGSFVSADLNSLVTNYGVQSNAINMEGLNEALDLLGTYGSYGDDANARAISAILRAQFSRDTTQADLGNSDTFRTMFPYYSSDVTAQFKSLVDHTSTLESRRKAIDLILVSQWLGKVHLANGSAISESILNDINGVTRQDGANALVYALQLNNDSAGEYKTPINGIEALSRLGADSSVLPSFGLSL